MIKLTIIILLQSFIVSSAFAKKSSKIGKFLNIEVGMKISDWRKDERNSKCSESKRKGLPEQIDAITFECRAFTNEVKLLGLHFYKNKLQTIEVLFLDFPVKAKKSKNRQWFQELKNIKEAVHGKFGKPSLVVTYGQQRIAPPQVDGYCGVNCAHEQWHDSKNKVLANLISGNNFSEAIFLSITDQRINKRFLRDYDRTQKKKADKYGF